MSDRETIGTFTRAVETGNVADARKIWNANPGLLDGTILSLNTYLEIAARIDNLDMLKCLVELGAELNSDKAKEVVGRLGGVKPAENCLGWLLEQGAPINEADGGKVRCEGLTTAILRGRLDLVKLFVDHGADINANAGDHSPLTLAIDRGEEEIADYLRSLGASERKRFPVPPDTDLDRRRKAYERAGGGRGHAIDLRFLRQEIRLAAARAFKAVRDECPGETYYAFALYSDDEASGVCPACNTEEGYAGVVKAYGYTEPAELNYLRWATAEWAYEYRGASAFELVGELLDFHDRYDGEEEGDIEALDAYLTGNTPNESDRFRGQVWACMVQALHDLDRKGFFGTGKQREQVTLMCSICDSVQTAWLADESVRRLNSEATYKAFIEQWLTVEEMADDLAKSRNKPNHPRQAFREFLDS